MSTEIEEFGSGIGFISMGQGNNYLQGPGAFRETTVATDEAENGHWWMRLDVLTWGKKAGLTRH